MPARATTGCSSTEPSVQAVMFEGVGSSGRTRTYPPSQRVRLIGPNASQWWTRGSSPSTVIHAEASDGRQPSGYQPGQTDLAACCSRLPRGTGRRLSLDASTTWHLPEGAARRRELLRVAARNWQESGKVGAVELDAPDWSRSLGRTHPPGCARILAGRGPT